MKAKPLNKIETTRVLTQIIQEHFDQLELDPKEIDLRNKKLSNLRALIHVAGYYSQLKGLFPLDKIIEFQEKYNSYVLTPYIKQQELYPTDSILKILGKK